MSNRLRLKVRTKIPAALIGGNGIDVVKDGLTYTVDLDYSQLATAITFDPSIQTIAIQSSVDGSWQKVSIAQIISSAAGLTPVTNAMSPYTPKPTDFFLQVDTTGGPVEIDLAQAALRGGLALSIKDAKGGAATNNITIKPVSLPAAETVDGFTNAAPLILNANYDGVRLLPITGGYSIAP